MDELVNRDTTRTYASPIHIQAIKHLNEHRNDNCLCIENYKNN